MNDVIVPRVFSTAKHTIAQPQYKKKEVYGEVWFQHFADGQGTRTKPILYFRGKQLRGSSQEHLLVECLMHGAGFQELIPGLSLFWRLITFGFSLCLKKSGSQKSAVRNSHLLA